MLLPRASLAVIYLPLLVVLVSGAMAGAAASGGGHPTRAIDAPADPAAIRASQICAVGEQTRARSQDRADAGCEGQVAAGGERSRGRDDARLERATAAR
jgi:hypothetical protein